MKNNYEVKTNSEESVLRMMKYENENGEKETILRMTSYDQVALCIRNGRFFAVAINGDEWEFDNFEQVSYFMLAGENQYDTKGNEIRERAMELFPNEVK